jgi:hypothetical protein
MIESDLIRGAGAANWATQTRAVPFQFLNELAMEFDKARDILRETAAPRMG